VNGKLQSFHISLTFEESVELNMSATTAVSGQKGISLGDYDVGVILLETVPVFVDFEPTLNVSASIQGSLDYEVRQGIQYTYTLSYNTQNPQPLTQSYTESCLDPSENLASYCAYFPSSPTPDVQAQANATLGLGLSFLVFDLAGFTITPSVQATINADTNVNQSDQPSCGSFTEGESVSPWWGSCFELNLAASAGLDVFGFGQVSLYSGTLYANLLAASESVGTSTGSAAVTEGTQAQLLAYVAGTSSSMWPASDQPTWTVTPQTGCGSVSSTGLYMAPNTASSGECEVTATYTQGFLFLGSNTISVSLDILPAGPTEAPVVSGVSPGGGPSSGGTMVTITGSGLTNANSIDFGPNNPSTSFTVLSDSSISALSPHGTGVVDVTVTTPLGTSPATASDQYAYSGASGTAPQAGYLETVLSEVNPDGSATDLYAFLTNSASAPSGLISAANSVSDLDFVVAFSEKGGLTLLPAFESSSLSEFESFIPPTIVFLGNTGDCASTLSGADQAAASVSSTLGLSDLNLLAAAPIFPAEQNEANQICLRVYESAANLDVVGPKVATNVLPTIHQTGLISVFENGLESGFLVPGATPSSVNATMLVTGYSNSAFLDDFLVVLGANTSSIPSSSNLFGFAGALAVQDGLVHSSTDIHTVNLAQLLTYPGAISFAPDSSLSEAGVGAPMGSSASNDLLPNDGLAVVTKDGSSAGSIFQNGQVTSDAELPDGQSLLPSSIQTTFPGLFPADLHVSKSLAMTSGGDVRVSLSVENLDTTPISIASLDDSHFLNSYRGGASLVSGSPDNDTGMTLGPGDTAEYSYVVRLSGVGLYTSQPALLSYELSGSSFNAESNTATWEQQGPGNAASAVLVLFDTAASTVAHGNNSNLTSLAVFAAFAALFALAGFMEYRSFRSWWEISPALAEKMQGANRMLESGLITEKEYQELRKRLMSG